MINVKSEKDLSDMAEGGKKLAKVLNNLLSASKPGVKLLTLEEKARKDIANAGGAPSFMTVKGYHWATCLCINDEVVHGIPTAYTLREGDLLTIDVGMLYRGLHTDTAWSIVVADTASGQKTETGKFLATGERVLWEAIRAVRPGNRIWHISNIIEQGITSQGYSVVSSLVGHGVGKELHEPPQVPGIVRGDIKSSPVLQAGMTVAIEVIYAMGKGDIVYSNDDGWTLATRDGSLSAVFEHTVAVSGNGVKVLTEDK